METLSGLGIHSGIEWYVVKVLIASPPSSTTFITVFLLTRSPFFNEYQEKLPDVTGRIFQRCFWLGMQLGHKHVLCLERRANGTTATTCTVA